MTSPVGKNNRGFSFFELVLVLLLLGVSMGVVLPNINRGLQEREVRSSALALAAAARELRGRALTDGVPQRLVLNLPDNSYVMARPPEVRLPREIRFMSVDGGESSERNLRSFYFFPNGSILGGEIVIGDTAQSISYLVRFEALTGRVTVGRAEQS